MLIKATSKNFSYPIIIGKNIISKLPDEIKKFTNSKKVLLLIDEYLWRIYSKELNKYFSKKNFNLYTLKIKAGKRCKDLSVLLKVIDLLEKNNFSKDSTLLAFGGGTIGDMGGFAASIFYRGINLVQIPTTLTAQIDSSIGGKVAINYNNNINAIGNYYHPRLILCDYNFIKTLSKRDFLSGLSEVIKSALITSSAQTNFLIKNKDKILARNEKIILEVLNKIIKIKLNIVKKDEREKNFRLFLNYGHTIGQAIESSFPLKKENYRHGEAVALGMLCASYIAEKKFGKKNLYKIHSKILKLFGLPFKIKKLSKTRKEIVKIIVQNTFKDKKKNFSGIRFVLLNGIGFPKIVSKIKLKLIEKSISLLVD